MRTSLDQFLAELKLVHRGHLPGLVDRLSGRGGSARRRAVGPGAGADQGADPLPGGGPLSGQGQGTVARALCGARPDRQGWDGEGLQGHPSRTPGRRRAEGAAPSFPRRNRATVKRFQHEAESLARLNHPSIVSCFERVKEVDGVYYLVMEYVNGRDLKFLVENLGAFPVVQAIECLLQTAKGLQSAHSLQIIHRDVKPANLMLDHTNTVRILDFGLARLMLPDPWLHDEGDATASRTILGTIPYMAPEQANDSTRADARSDIYSLGCTLHFLLTGRPPYRGRTWSKMFQAHRKAPIPSLKAACPSVPDYLEDLFRRMLAKDPADRPRTMAAVVAATELALAESHRTPLLADHPRPLPRRVRFRADGLPRRPGNRIPREAPSQGVLLHGPPAPTIGRDLGLHSHGQVPPAGRCRDRRAHHPDRVDPAPRPRGRAGPRGPVRFRVRPRITDQSQGWPPTLLDACSRVVRGEGRRVRRHRAASMTRSTGVAACSEPAGGSDVGGRSRPRSGPTRSTDRRREIRSIPTDRSPARAGSRSGPIRIDGTRRLGPRTGPHSSPTPILAASPRCVARAKHAKRARIGHPKIGCCR